MEQGAWSCAFIIGPDGEPPLSSRFGWNLGSLCETKQNLIF